MSVHNIEMRTLSGESTSLTDHQGKALLLVNVASKCGLTPQYEGLERIHERYAPDKAPGDTNGQGVGGIWFVVLLSGSSAAAGGGGTTATTVVTRATTPATTASCAYPPCP